VALGGAAAAAGGKRIHAPAPGFDKLAQRVKTWLQDFF
jgi:hypothetical protein